MESIEVEARHKPLILKFLEKMEKLQNGEIKIIFRDGQAERIDRNEWELTRARVRPNSIQPA